MTELMRRRRALMAVGGGSSPILPSEYQQVEWIGSSGTQRIDPDILISNLKTEGWVAEIALQDNGNPSSNSGVLSVKQNAGEWFGVNAATLKHLNGVSTLNKVDVTVSWDSVGMTVASGLNNQITAYTNYLSGTKFTIFAIAVTDTSFSYFSSIKLYSMTIKRAGTIVANLIPCYRKSDNVIGLYDTARDRFFVNSGTGTFTKGSNV